MAKSKRQQEVEIVSRYEGLTPVQLIERIDTAAKKFSDPVMDVELDWGGCYYEGDQPSTKLIMKERGM